MNQLRDGAYTTAIEGGARLEHVEALAGHKIGIADRYLRRSPTIVAEACAEIEKAYFG